MSHQYEVDQKAFEDIFGYRKGHTLSTEDTILKVARMDAWNEALKWERQKPAESNHTPILNVRENLLKYRTSLLTTADRIQNDMNVLYRLTLDHKPSEPITGKPLTDHDIRINKKIMNHPANRQT